MSNSLYENADLYEKIFEMDNDEEVDFYVKEAEQTKGNILYIGTGIGRVFIPMMKKNKSIIGIDKHEEMLEKLRKNAKENDMQDVEVYKMDMQNFKFNKKFDLVVMPGRTFCHLLTRNDQKGVFIRILEHLNANGRLILNFYSSNSNKPKGIMSIENRKVFIREMQLLDEKILIWTAHKKNEFKQTYTRYFFSEHYDINNKKNKEYCFSIDMRYTYIYEFENLAELTGFKSIKNYGDFNKTVFNENSSEVIWELRK